MDASLMSYSSGDYKHRIGNPNVRISGSYNRNLYSYPSDNVLLASFLANNHLSGGGLLSTPPASLYHSYPPLVPLPLINHQNMILSRRDHSVTPKKSKNQKKDLKKEEPEPKDVAKDVVARVSNESNNDSCDDVVPVDKFSGSIVFTPSPPPSSLPLPTFLLRSKVSCRAEVAARGFDAGATDGLQRLLRIR
ncbi:hypothetical protein CTI12_AA152570 [Artemisia annua]|uniref:Uncharacterized protein n=1 Tax=Artemisia annua TaxID=35608 RepID=A0A2U1PHX7_ARTAN|nr:hypothetical protein CTI12_AA152570 [Artemisia annua]